MTQGLRAAGCLAAVLLATGAAAWAAMQGEAAPTPAVLSFTGRHLADAGLPAGVRHEGEFTAQPPFCPSGTAVDVRHPKIAPLTVHRLHRCDDGTGSFTVEMEEAFEEHNPVEPEGRGPWKIIEGDGRYATLRGRGTYTSVILGGDPTVPLTLTFRTRWQGIVDLDATPPRTALASAKASMVRGRPGQFALRLVLDIRDNTSGNRVSYQVVIRAGARPLALKRGATSSGRLALSVRVKPPRRVASLRVEVDVSDPLGNEASATHRLRVRR